MPHINSLIPKTPEFDILFGQRPLTRFRDYRKSIKVDLIKHDNKEEMLKGTYDFVKATWSQDGKESERASKEEMIDALNQMFEGKALQLGLETVNFIFRISGITRIDTHQLVRQRIGVTFSQMCSGDQFWNHRDCLVEECIAQDKDLLDRYIRTTLIAKDLYATLNDSLKVSIQSSREILPQNLDLFIFMKVDLSTLLFFYKKRIDNESQTWAINEIARQMQEEVCKVFPEMKTAFDKMKGSFDFQRKAASDRQNTFSTGLYIPEKDEFDYHNRDFLYPLKKNEMHFTNTPIDDTYYWGFKEITKQQYEDIKLEYQAHNKTVKNMHYSNEEILERAELLNVNINHTLS